MAADQGVRVDANPTKPSDDLERLRRVTGVCKKHQESNPCSVCAVVEAAKRAAESGSSERDQ